MHDGYVYINGNQYNQNQPYTFNIFKVETMLFWYETNDPNVTFGLTWESSYYDPRN
jgi:hypothetical protein